MFLYQFRNSLALPQQSRNCFLCSCLARNFWLTKQPFLRSTKIALAMNRNLKSSKFIYAKSDENLNPLELRSERIGAVVGISKMAGARLSTRQWRIIMECNFVVGQKVVCVSDEPDPVHDPLNETADLKIGGIYEISQMVPNHGTIFVSLNECGPEYYYSYDCFRPLHETDISIFTAMLAPVTEKVGA